jgi:uncharacterized protein YecE (DUF72 family)
VAWLIGTSGWQYRDWRGVLYPPGVPQRLWLEFYTEQFATVENNNAFYRLPSKEMFTAWAERTPPGFVMAVKASRYLTHIRRLKDPAEPVGRLLGAAAGLGATLGPILLQLPPTWKGDPGLLDETLAEFRRGGPAGLRIAVEMRHESCWTDEMRRVLTDRGAALAWTDRGESPVGPLWRTTDWGYLRLHEGAAQPWPRYTRDGLRAWSERLSASWPAGSAGGNGVARDAGGAGGSGVEAYVYFNNDPGGAAIYDAVAFAAIAREAGQTVTRTPDMVPPVAGGPVR